MQTHRTYYFHVKTKISLNFHISISEPLNQYVTTGDADSNILIIPEAVAVKADMVLSSANL